MKKDIAKIFRAHNLRITIEPCSHQANFLDTTLDLRTCKYHPYRKPNDTSLYIHRESNNPPNILSELPTMISDRISTLSCNQEEFETAQGEYNTSLKNSGFNEKIKYQPKPENCQPRQRRRNIIWFNPPFSKQVTTNIGKHFLALISKHFPPQHKYAKIFNRHTIKARGGGVKGYF